MLRCGTDIIEISRIKKAIETNDKFKEKIFTDSEILYSESKKTSKYEAYAARFAAKEAVFKAISGKVDTKEIMWKSIEVINDNCGKPSIKLSINIPELKYIDISLSHCKEYAVANVIAEFKD